MKLYVVAYRKYNTRYHEYETEIVKAFKNEINALHFKHTKEGIEGVSKNYSKSYFITEIESGDF